MPQPFREQVKNVFFYLHEKMYEGVARVVQSQAIIVPQPLKEKVKSMFFTYMKKCLKGLKGLCNLKPFCALTL